MWEFGTILKYVDGREAERFMFLRPYEGVSEQFAEVVVLVSDYNAAVGEGGIDFVSVAAMEVVDVLD